MEKQIKYIIQCVICKKQEENMPSKISFDGNNVYFDNTDFLFYKGKEFCSKKCLKQLLIDEGIKPLKIKEIVQGIISPKEKKLLEKREKETRLATLKTLWEEDDKNRKPPWEKLGLSYLEYKARIITGVGRHGKNDEFLYCSVPIGKDEKGFPIFKEIEMKVVDYHSNPPLIPKEFFSEERQKSWIK